MEHGAWSMEHGAWSMEHGAWKLENDIMSMVSMSIQIKGYTPMNNLPGEEMTPKHLMLSNFVGWNCWCGNEEHCMVCNQTMMTCKTYEAVMVWRTSIESSSSSKARTEYLRTVCTECLAILKKEYAEDSEQPAIDDKIMVSTLQGQLYYTDRVSQAVTDLEQLHPPCQRPVFSIEITAIQQTDADAEPRENYVHTILHPANEMQYTWKMQPIDLWPRKVDSYGIYDNHCHTFYPPEKEQRLLPEVPITTIITTLRYNGLSEQQPGRIQNVLARCEIPWSPHRKIQYHVDIDRHARWTIDMHLYEPCDYSLTPYTTKTDDDWM